MALLVSFVSGIALVGTSSASALASTARPGYGPGPARTHCPRGGVPPTSRFSPPNPQVVPYFLGDYRLGPKYLPLRGPIAKMLIGYVRYDDTAPYQFIGCFWRMTPTADNWRYPIDMGFVVIDGKPIERTVTLRPGQEIDLFGNPGNTSATTSSGGQFLAPAGTPYAERAIPPTNLDTYPGNNQFNYYRYEVVKKFPVLAGPVAPWFDQPGGGIQDYLGDTTGPGLPASPGIANLVKAGYVKVVPVS